MKKENLNPKRLHILLMLLMKRCHEMQTTYPKTKTKLETYEISSFANVVNPNFDNDDNFFFIIIITDPKFSHFQILDCGCSFHICPYKECFNTHKESDINIILISNDSSFKALEIGIMRMKILDSMVSTLTHDKYIPKLRRSLNSLKAWIL